VELGGLVAAVGDGDPAHHYRRLRLGVLHFHVEVTVLVEESQVKQLYLRPRSGVALAQLLIWEGVHRIAVDRPQVASVREGVEVMPVLLDILAVIALGVGEAKEPLL
jgi:hypothetical protein